MSSNQALKKQFLEVLPIFSRPTELQHKLSILVEATNIIGNQQKKESVWVFGVKFGPN